MQQKIKYKFLILAVAFSLLAATPPRPVAHASGCPDLRIVFARGSGEERWTNINYLDFKSKIQEKLATTSLSYEFIDLDYPAVGVDEIGTALGAFFSGGKSYKFGDSVNTGVNNLVRLVNSGCAETKYILGGYSQGAMVISKSLPKLKEDKIIYVATFGDPKIYLPEGFGMVPIACSGEGLSSYRMYVPDCQAFIGLLGANIPYHPENMTGKVGTWCNKSDIFCSSHFSISDHVSYVSDGLYNDASKVIFDKICKAFSVDNKVSSPHDTVIILDSTGSMSAMIEKYKAEALRLASETLKVGGRVALYDYRDLSDPYEPVEHCNFETCTLETFKNALDSIEVDGGGDTNESLLSASLYIMNSLKWRFGATKSAVVLTDAPFLLPDRDGVTLDDVIRLSKEIDPVNFYIITDPELEEDYTELATRTDGMVVTDFGKLSLLTNYILDRYDSLPRVEEGPSEELPSIEVLEVIDNLDEVSVRFDSSSGRALIILNDVILGIVEGNEFYINELSRDTENVINLVPLTDNLRGEGTTIHLETKVIPKAPDTGRA
ncbi:MAG: cutinase family protein [Candidatus Saccharibacteria bacterium]|nr:cutinase family protein [Candidatus Saccharibacteria bacterium]